MQPFISVPVTVYVVVVAGISVTLAPVKLPGIQTYPPAPLALSSTLLPVQTPELLLVAITVGESFTVTVTVAVLLHPLIVSVPVTV